MNAYFVAAGLLSGAVLMLHIFVGGPKIARPLLAASDIRPVSKFTNYYCWHIVSIVLAAMTACFLYVGWTGDGPELAVLMTGFAASFAGWSVALVLWKRQSPLAMPQWALFTGVTALGLAGIAA